MTISEPIHETANLYLIQIADGSLEIRLNGATHAVLVGKPTDVDKGKRTMERLERYPKALRTFYNHY